GFRVNDPYTGGFSFILIVDDFGYDRIWPKDEISGCGCSGKGGGVGAEIAPERTTTFTSSPILARTTISDFFSQISGSTVNNESFTTECFFDSLGDDFFDAVHGHWR